MNKALKILSFLLLTIVNCKAQNSEPSDFIPKGYTEFERYIGDLSNDGQKDCALIIKKNDTTNIVTNRFNKKVEEIDMGLLCYLKTRKVSNLLIKIMTVSHPKMKMEEFIIRPNYGLKLKMKNCISTINTADTDIGNTLLGFKTRILN